MTKLWKSVEDLAEAVSAGYSVSDPDVMRVLYAEQVEKYPMYQKALEMVAGTIGNIGGHLEVVEYGPGPGFLAKMLVNSPNVAGYTAVEPNETFREMTQENIGDSNKPIRIMNGTAETHDYQKVSGCRNPYDVAAATFTTHHFPDFDKRPSLRKLRHNLKADGNFVIAEVFLPEYEYNKSYRPKDRKRFVEAVIQYATSQILGMLSPTKDSVIDQIKTYLQDLTRIGEHKICLSAFLRQLEESGFVSIDSKLIEGKGQLPNGIADEDLGYCFITAKTKKRVRKKNRPHSIPS